MGARGGLLSSFAPIVAGVLLAIVLQFAAAPLVGPFAAKLLMDIGINIILAVSLNLVNGFTGQFSIGHAGFMAIGGYVAGGITFYGSILIFGSAKAIPGWLTPGDALFVAGCLAGALVAGAAGWLVGLPSLRLRGDYLAIVTLGFGEIVRVLLQQTGDVVTNVDAVRAASFGTLAASMGGSLGFSGLPYYTDLFWVYVFVTIMLVVAFRLKFSSLGRAFLSIRENEIAAEAVGINTTNLKVKAFVLAAGFAGIAGGLFAHEVGTSLNPRELGFMKSFDIIIMVVLGGMGSVSGAVLAAIVLTLLPEILRSASEFRMPIYALALILMMILRPQGLLGLKEIWEMPWLKGRQKRSGGDAA
jgi:branched-chain amino acid transport system permease protein